MAVLTSCQNSNKPLVLGKVKQVSDFATTEVSIKKFILATKEKRRLVRLKDAKFAAEAFATLKFGIDLDGLKEDDITIDQESLSIRVPNIKLIDFTMPPDKIRELEALTDRKKFLNYMDFGDVDTALRIASTEIGESIDYMGIEETIIQNTETAILGLLKDHNFKSVHVEVVSSEFDISKFF